MTRDGITIKRPLLETIYEAATMRRWNDKICPVELRELDKQAHKMIIAYVMGKFEENRKDFSWVKVIEGGIFEFLQRVIVTDLKPQFFDKIKNNESSYAELNSWVYKKLEPQLSRFDVEFCQRFKDYFSDTAGSLHKKILQAAHFYATKWEFDIVERANPSTYEISDIRKRIEKELQKHEDLTGMQRLVMRSNLRSFVDLCGQLRFQLRWSHIDMSPRTSVLGHMLIVAMVAYLLSLKLSACERRCFNNYFTGLFHDLPEVLTRDIISPVKESVRGLKQIIKQYEKKQMEEEVYTLIPEEWLPEMTMFTEDEFKTIVAINGKTTKTSSAEINQQYNRDEFYPRDGQVIEAIDRLNAMIESYLSLHNGVKCGQLKDAQKKSLEWVSKRAIIADIDFLSMFEYFQYFE